MGRPKGSRRLSQVYRMPPESQEKVTRGGEKIQVGWAEIFQRAEQVEGEGKGGGKSGGQRPPEPLPSALPWVKPSLRLSLTNLVATSHMWQLSLGNVACH